MVTRLSKSVTSADVLASVIDSVHGWSAHGFDTVDPGCDQNEIEAQDSFFAAVEELAVSI